MNRSRSWRAAAGVALACVVVAVPTGARAEQVGLLAYRAGEAPPWSPQVAAAVARAVARSGNTPVRDPIAAARRRRALGAVPAGRLRDFRRVRQLEAEGWRAFLSVEPRFAAGRLGSARTAVQRVLDLPGGMAMCADISLRLGAVKLQLGRAQEAAKEFRFAAVLDPTRRVTVAEFSPDVVTAYRAARAAPPARLLLRVETDPAGAEVDIDGRKAGTAPVAIPVAPGRHAVVARAPGRAAQGRIVTVSAGSTKLRLVLDRDAWAAAVAGGAGSLAPGRAGVDALVASEGIAVYAELDSLLFTASVWRHGQPALLGQYCAGAPLSCSRVVEIRYPGRRGLAAAAGELWRKLRQARRAPRRPPTLLVDARLLHGEAAPRRARAAAASARPWWKSRWLWIGVGSAAAVAAGTIWLVGGSAPATPVIAVPKPCEFGGC